MKPNFKNSKADYLRKTDQINTSYRSYELLMISIQKNCKDIESITELFKDTHNAIANNMNAHCKSYAPLHMDEACICDDWAYCPIRTDKRRDCLQSKLDACRHEGNTDPILIETLEKRIGRLCEKGTWNFPQKRLNCAKRIHDENTNCQALLGFGTVDIISIQPTSSMLWAGAFRMHYTIDPLVSGLFGFPMHRIKFSRGIYEQTEQTCDGQKDYRIVRDTSHVIPKPDPKKSTSNYRKNENQSRFLCYTFLFKSSTRDKLRDDKSSKTKAEELNEIINFLLKSEDDKGNIIDPPLRELLKKEDIEYNNLNLEVFLSFCVTFPIVLKSEFTTIDDLTKYLTILEREMPYIRRSSTVVAWYPIDIYEGRPDISGTAKTDTVFQLLVKCKGNPSDVAKKVIKILQNEKNGLNAIVYEKPYDKGNGVGGIEVEKGDSDSVAQLDIDRKWSRRSYDWDFCIHLSTKEISKLCKVIVEKIRTDPLIIETSTMPLLSKFEYVKETNPDDPGIENNKPNGDVVKQEAENIHNLWKKGINIHAMLPKIAPDVRRSEDILNLKWSGLRQEYRWLLSYVSQLNSSWNTQTKLRNIEAQEGSKSPSTFTDIHQLIKEAIDEITQNDEALDKLQQAKIQNVPDELLNMAIADRWETYRWKSILANHIKRSLMDITSEFNEKTEGHQAITVAEHFLKVGEQTGVMDMIVESVGRLFLHYCTYPHPESKNWGKKKDGFWEPWGGIVTSSIGEDFKLKPLLRMLYLPVDIKFQTYGKLLTVSHEAAHQVLYWIFLTKNKTPSAFHKFYFNVWDNMLLWMGDWWRKQLDEDDASIDLRKTPEFNLKNPQLFKIEFLTDLFALLTAGPALINNLMVFCYQPSTQAKKSNEIVHPPIWLRIALLYKACKALGWLEDDDFQIEDMVEHHFERHEGADKKVFITGSTVEILDKIGKIDRNTRYEIPFLIYYETEQGKKFLRNLVKYVQEEGTNFLFYPLPIEGLEPSPEEMDRIWEEEYPRVIRLINQYCGSLTDRLVYNDEVILDAPLKYISAATAHPDVTHPHYSMGRTLHSIYYSDDHKGYKKLQEIFTHYMKKEIFYIS